LIFVSHASTDQELAKVIAAEIEACQPGLKVFLASRAGDIRAGAEWLFSVQGALREASAYLILLTPNSVLRPWVSFETGAAWFSGKTCILARAAGLKPEEIPLPLASKQVYSLESDGDVCAVFDALLGHGPSDATQFVQKILSSAQPVGFAGDAEPAWEGVHWQGTFYAWAGPLLGLDDKPEVACPPQLPELLKQRGMSVRFGKADRLSHHYGRGRSQVFATDRHSWRRPVVQGGQLLLVARPEDLKR
jgi:hypothetical protein